MFFIILGTYTRWTFIIFSLVQRILLLIFRCHTVTHGTDLRRSPPGRDALAITPAGPTLQPPFAFSAPDLGARISGGFRRRLGERERVVQTNPSLTENTHLSLFHCLMYQFGPGLLTFSSNIRETRMAY